MTLQERSGEFPWEKIETTIFIWALLAKTLLFLMHLGVNFGYDVDGHLKAMSVVNWLHPFFDLRSFYYASHPPLGFLFANTIGFALRTSPLVSAQIVAFLSSLTIFWFLRKSLKGLHLLHRPGVIAFLYFIVGIPLQSYMAVMVNLDVTVFAFASIVLYASIRVMRSEQHRILTWDVALAGLASAAAALTKESGLLTLTLPFLCIIIFGKSLRAHAKRLAVIIGIFFALVFPYYFVNYYLAEGTFVFNSACVTDYADSCQEGLDTWNADPKGYIQRVFIGQNGEEAHLRPTWRSLWSAEDRDPQSEMAYWYIITYLSIMPWLALVGFILFLFGLPRDKDYFHFGVVCIFFSALLFLAQLFYIFRYPLDWYYGFNKGIYIAHASLGVCFLISLAAEAPTLLPIRFAKTRRFAQQALLFAILLFLTANTLIPVY